MPERVIGDLVRALEPGESEREIARRAADALAERRMRAVVILVAGDDRIRKFRTSSAHRTQVGKTADDCRLRRARRFDSLFDAHHLCWTSPC